MYNQQQSTYNDRIMMVTLLTLLIFFIQTMHVMAKGHQLVQDCNSAPSLENALNGEKVEIFVPNGPIVGEKYSILGHWITRFLGIPYAKPPVGSLRFRRPVPIEKWNQSVQALQWPNNCFQIPKSPAHRLRYFNQNFTEDCLYLNIWSPDVNVNEQNLRPVLVWIHGGGLNFGGTSDRLIDMERLAIMADAVMVSINYRLSALGFLYSDQVDDIKGNQGLWDQVMALQWVNENIRYFGGDPKAITLMGNSAGSWSVSLHILSPHSRNLFQNAILMSGAANYNVVQNKEHYLLKLLTLLRSIGCATQDDLSVTAKIIECLEKADLETLDKISKLRPKIVIDGDFLPDDPNKMIMNGDHKKNFKLLVSTVEDEGSFLFARYQPSFSGDVSLDAAKQVLIDSLNEINNNQTYDNETILKAYFSGFNPNYDDPDLFKKQAGIAYGDLILGCPTIRFAKGLYKSSPSTIDVYQWFYKAKIGSIKSLCTKWSGTCHADDLYPVFAIPFGEEEHFHNRERELSREIINFIQSFIRTGKPGKEQPEWLNYFMSKGGNVVAPYYEISNQHKTYQSFKLNLKQFECEIVWETFYQ